SCRTKRHFWKSPGSSIKEASSMVSTRRLNQFFNYRNMTQVLKVMGASKVSKRRLGGDLQMRNDLLTRNPSEFITKMVSLVKPASPFLVFTNLFGETTDMYGQDSKLFDVQTSSIGAEFIRIKEEIK